MKMRTIRCYMTHRTWTTDKEGQSGFTNARAQGVATLDLDRLFESAPAGRLQWRALPFNVLVLASKETFFMDADVCGHSEDG